MTGPLIALACTILGAFLALGGLVWKLASLTTRFEVGLEKLAGDVGRIEPRLAQLDKIASLERGVAGLEAATSDLSGRLTKHDSHIADLLQRTAHSQGAEAARQSQGNFHR